MDLQILLIVPVFIGVRANFGVLKSGQGKLADLDALLISKESVDNRIEELKQILSTSRVQTYPDMSRRDPTSQDTSGHGVPNEKEKDELLQKVTSLEKENQDLKILNAGKDYLVQQFKEERVGMIEQIRADAHRVGELETKLLQLEAPKHTPPVDEFAGQ